MLIVTLNRKIDDAGILSVINDDAGSIRAAFRFNDMPFIDRLPLGIHTLRIQTFDVGRVAAEHLLGMMCGRARKVPRETVLPVELLQRRSVASPRSHALARNQSKSPWRNAKKKAGEFFKELASQAVIHAPRIETCCLRLFQSFKRYRNVVFPA